MRKIAFFVEGYTEVLFISKLIQEIAGAKNILIEQKRISGGTKVPKKIITLHGAKKVTNEEYYALIYDCGGDHQVKPRILEEHQNLTKQGYEKIWGLRDLAPQYSFSELKKVENGLPLYIKTSLIPVEILLSIMEVEAWYLAEHSHFSKISQSISIERVRGELAIDPENDDLSKRPTPAIDLNNVYSLGGESYKKGSEITSEALDYAEVYLRISQRIPNLLKICEGLNLFLQ